MLQVHGTEGLSAVMDKSCELAQLLCEKISQNSDKLELMQPQVTLNIVCFRYRNLSADKEESASDQREALWNRWA